AAYKSGAHTVIERLDDGYDTMLGRWFDEGVQLSGGEWQKIALARAFMRDARILILDEPTSSLDAQAEYEVFSHFRALTEGKTAIFISHRFSTVRLADRIFVIENGTIIENGSHRELMDLDGRYAELFNLQAEAYR
ncbi:MAG TPA: ATP-binding cassette domain-containing protein, partial [Ktedonobacteraceae bacterium]|nr:ATP-binding cassette domain-containing protein [Ktedonobacteraceae bacterium]